MPAIRYTVDKAPAMGASHYAYIAEIIRTLEISKAGRLRLAAAFGKALKAGNSRFRVDIFYVACDPRLFGEKMEMLNKRSKSHVRPTRLTRY